jgi:hypothetical protein
MNREAKLFIIGEAYIKFDFEYSEKNKAMIKRAYLEQIGLKSNEFFKVKEFIKISIEYDKGSLKTKIVIWGTTLVNLYFFIGNYGGFKDSAKELMKDVNSFSSYVIEHINQDPNIHQNNVLTTQCRTGLLGRINDVYQRIESLERNLNEMSQNEIHEEVNGIRQEVSNLRDILSEPERDAFIQSINMQYHQNAPQPDEKKTAYLYNRYALKPEDEIEILEE